MAEPAQPVTGTAPVVEGGFWSSVGRRIDSGMRFAANGIVETISLVPRGGVYVATGAASLVSNVQTRDIGGFNMDDVVGAASSLFNGRSREESIAAERAITAERDVSVETPLGAISAGDVVGFASGGLVGGAAVRGTNLAFSGLRAVGGRVIGAEAAPLAQAVAAPTTWFGRRLAGVRSFLTPGSVAMAGGIVAAVSSPAAAEQPPTGGTGTMGPGTTAARPPAAAATAAPPGSTAAAGTPPASPPTAPTGGSQEANSTLGFLNGLYQIPAFKSIFDTIAGWLGVESAGGRAGGQNLLTIIAGLFGITPAAPAGQGQPAQPPAGTATAPAGTTPVAGNRPAATPGDRGILRALTAQSFQTNLTAQETNVGIPSPATFTFADVPDLTPRQREARAWLEQNLRPEQVPVALSLMGKIRDSRNNHTQLQLSQQEREMRTGPIGQHLEAAVVVEVNVFNQQLHREVPQGAVTGQRAPAPAAP